MYFPRSVHVDHLTISEQVDKIASELEEVEKEIGNPPINFESVSIELWDLIHACETGLRILEEQYEVNVNVTRQYVFEKNRARGYYHDNR